MGQNTTLEIRADLALDEASHGSTRGSGAREERLQILADDAMQERLLGLMAFVTNRGGFAGTGLESTSLRNPHAGVRRRRQGRLTRHLELPLQIGLSESRPIVHRPIVNSRGRSPFEITWRTSFRSG